MNYFEHHIGDYDQATAHLSAVEDGIYSRLIRWYMAGEQALPNDITAIQRRVRAHSRDEKAAVKTVLAEFFEQQDDGYHQHRCDEEIARYQAKQEKARASANKRWANAQNTSEGNANASNQHDAQDMQTHSEGNAPRARPQTPDTKHQTQNRGVTTIGDTSTVVEPGAAGALCLALRRVGVMAQPHHPQVLALVAQGVAVESVVAAAEEGKRSYPGERIGIGLVVKILESWAKRAQAMNVAGARPPSQQQTSRDAQRAGAMNSIGLGGHHDPQPRTIDAATGDLID